MRQVCFLLVSSLTLVAAGRASAEPSNDEVAAAHFQRGLDDAKAGEIDAAATEFEAAYKASPNFAVLYNLGRTYAAMGRAVDAVNAFKRYLSDGSGSIDPKRHQEVTDSIVLNEKRIGQADIEVEPASAEVQLDGRALATTRSNIQLVVGDHVLAASAPGYRSTTQAFTVQHTGAVSVRVRLTQEASPATSNVWLSVTCNVPGVAMLVDDAARGSTPFRTPIAVTEGSHRITFQRPGYARTTITWLPSSSSTVDCGVKLGALAPSDSSTLVVTSSEPDAETFVDGTRWEHSPLPFGTHHLELKRFGFQTWGKDLEFRRGEDKQLAIRLVPVPEYAEEHRHQIRTMRIASYGLVGVGSALLVTAGSLELLSSREYETWRQARDTANQTPSTAASYQDILQNAAQQALRVRTLDDWALSSAIVGSSLLVAGVVLLFTAEDPKRYELPSARLTSSGANLEWQHAF